MSQVTKIYHCNNSDLPCKYYKEQIEFSLRDGEDERCPACKKADITFIRSEGIDIAGKGKKWGLIILGILLAIGAGWWLISKSATHSGSASQTDPKRNNASSSVPIAQPGIDSSEVNTSSAHPDTAIAKKGASANSPANQQDQRGDPNPPMHRHEKPAPTVFPSHNQDNRPPGAPDDPFKKPQPGKKNL